MRIFAETKKRENDFLSVFFVFVFVSGGPSCCQNACSRIRNAGKKNLKFDLKSFSFLCLCLCLCL